MLGVHGAVQLSDLFRVLKTVLRTDVVAAEKHGTNLRLLLAQLLYRLAVSARSRARLDVLPDDVLNTPDANAVLMITHRTFVSAAPCDLFRVTTIH